MTPDAVLLSDSISRKYNIAIVYTFNTKATWEKQKQLNTFNNAIT